MNGDIKFSVMTPVYKVEKYLDECVMSVLGQSYENFELILVDDGSPDRSGEMCDAWAQKDSRIKAFHKTNGGLVSARSCALEHVSGDYYVFLDSDDYLHSDALETMYNKIKASNADCVIYGSEKKLGDKVIEVAVCGKDIEDRLITDKREFLNIILTNGGYNSLCRKCTRAACFDGRDYSEYYKITQSEDLMRSLEILEYAQSVLFIPEILHVYRCNEESVTQTINYNDYLSENIVEKLVDSFLEKAGVFTETDYNRLRNMRLDYLAVDARRRARYCTDTKTAVENMARLRETEYASKILAVGYRPSAGAEGQSKLQKLMYRINIYLLAHRSYRTFILVDRLAMKLLGR